MSGVTIGIIEMVAVWVGLVLFFDWIEKKWLQ